MRINKLEEALMKLMEKSNEINKEDRKALEYIRYLFKDFAFRDEEEFRLLKIEKSTRIKSNTVKLRNPSICLMLMHAILWMK